ncbi:MAG: CHC2 zinc finger domain-containing protein, partial [Tannerellaceae bacterium]|nr:CHC2 zinc finger domain-containing protein [Tannerellaceae bacterium]
MKQQYDITHVIRQYLPLQQSGSRWKGLCPFHDDHHPSLTVDPGKQRFVCYACGERGDAISFIQKIERCSFKEALEKLTPESSHPPERGGEKTVPPLTPPSGGRGSLSSVGDWSELLPQLMPPVTGDSHLTPTYLEFEGGVAPHLLPGKWKMMAGRLLFPIHDEHGQFAGLAGRSLAPQAGGREDSNGDSPKYLNTPGLPRSSLLYGLHRAKEKIRQTGTAYLVEGFKDVIAMHAAGIQETVGLCGTQLAGGQQELLRRYARRVILVMDGDPAGQEAARRIAATLRQAGLETAAIDLPGGTDPDSLFREQGPEAFARYITEQAPFTGPMELRLLTALSLYPTTRMHFRDEWHPFPRILDTILTAENLPFEKESHRQALAVYVAGQTP